MAVRSAAAARSSAHSCSNVTVPPSPSGQATPPHSRTHRPDHLSQASSPTRNRRVGDLPKPGRERSNIGRITPLADGITGAAAVTFLPSQRLPSVADKSPDGDRAKTTCLILPRRTRGTIEADRREPPSVRHCSPQRPFRGGLQNRHLLHMVCHRKDVTSCKTEKGRRMPALEALSTVSEGGSHQRPGTASRSGPSLVLQATLRLHR